MTVRSDYVAKQYHGLLSKRGGLITLRRLVRQLGSNPASNPPRVGQLTLRSLHTPGATVLLLASSQLVGGVLPGDTFTVEGQRLTATAMAIAANNQIDIPVTPAFQGTKPSGTLVTPKWKNDYEIPANVVPYARNLVDGSLIETRDLAVIISAHGIPGEPGTEDVVILPGGDIRRVIAVTPQMTQGIPTSYTLQVR